MLTPDLANGESGSTLEPAAVLNPSKSSRALRRRRSRSWAQFDLERKLRPVVQVRPTEELTPRGGVFEGENGSGGGPERGDTASVGASPRYSHRRWFPFFGRKSSIPPPMGREEAVGRPAASRQADKAGASWRWKNYPADGASAIEEATGDGNAHSEGTSGSRIEQAAAAWEIERVMILTPPPGPAGFAGTAVAAAAGEKETPAPGPKATLPSEEEIRRQLGAAGGKGATGLLSADGPSKAFTPPTSGGVADDPDSTLGRRKNRQGVSLRRGASKTTTARSASIGLETGARVLCLDILASANGGDEIRRWRPAEVRGELVLWPTHSSSIAVDDATRCSA